MSFSHVKGAPILTSSKNALDVREDEWNEKILVRKIQKLPMVEKVLDEESLSQLVSIGLKKFAPVEKPVEVVRVNNLGNESDSVHDAAPHVSLGVLDLDE